MSTAYARSDYRALSSLAGESIIAVLIFTVPATLGMLILAEPIFAVLFMRGAFGMEDVRATAFALQMYSIGLCAVGVSRILTQALYAMQKPKEVVRTAWISLAVNAVLSLALMPFLGFGGIALASSLSVAVQTAIMYRIISREGIEMPSEAWGKILRMMAASLGMAIILVAFIHMKFWLGGLSVMSVTILLCSILAGGGIYFGLLWLMGLRYSIR